MLIFRKHFSSTDTYPIGNDKRKEDLINSSIAGTSGLGIGAGIKYIGDKLIDSKTNKAKEDINLKLIKKYILPLDPNLDKVDEMHNSLKKYGNVKSKAIKIIESKAKKAKKIGKITAGVVGLGTGLEVYRNLKNKKK